MCASQCVVCLGRQLQENHWSCAWFVMDDYTVLQLQQLHNTAQYIKSIENGDKRHNSMLFVPTCHDKCISARLFHRQLSVNRIIPLSSAQAPRHDVVDDKTATGSETLQPRSLSQTSTTRRFGDVSQCCGDAVAAARRRAPQDANLMVVRRVRGDHMTLRVMAGLIFLAVHLHQSVYI